MIPVLKNLATRLIHLNLTTKGAITHYNNYFTMSDKTVSALMIRLEDAEKTINMLQKEVHLIKKELNKINVPSRSYSTGNKRPLDDIPDIDFDLKRVKGEFCKENDCVVVYTDGACSKNGFAGAKAGIGVWWSENHPLNVSKSTARRNTNNSAEIQACTEACNVAAQNGIDKLVIKTDSQFVINCMTKWIKNWKKNNWKTAAGKPVINKEDLLELEKSSQLLKLVKYEYVPGHKGVAGNEGADRLAVLGAEK